MKKSSGILVYRLKNNKREYFLVHPGGPFWKNKDAGTWSIPKGEFLQDEDPLDAAKREFKEETGQEISGNFIELKSIKQPSGKMVYAWAVEGNVDEEKIVSNTIEIPWPPKTGKMLTIPEVDKGGWFDLKVALVKIVKGQSGFLTEIETLLNK